MDAVTSSAVVRDREEAPVLGLVGGLKLFTIPAWLFLHGMLVALSQVGGIKSAIQRRWGGTNS